MLPLGKLAPSLGLDPLTVDIDAVPSLNMARNEIGCLDVYRSTAGNNRTGDRGSVYARVIRPNAASPKGGPPHVICLADCQAGRVGSFRVFGVVHDWPIDPTAVNGEGVIAGAALAGTKVFGLVLDKQPGASTASILWDGQHGFGEIEPPDTGGNTPPEAAITATPDTGTAPITVTLDASASADGDGSIVKYEFNPDYGGGWIDNGTNATLNVTYPFGGVYDPSVRVTDDGGAIDTASTRIVIEDQAGGGDGGNGHDAGADGGDPTGGDQSEAGGGVVPR